MAGALARQMDYWFEHPEEREKMSRRYAEYGDTMRVEHCVEQAEEMYEQTIAAFRKEGAPKPRESRLRKLTHPDTEKTAAAFGKGSMLRTVLSGLLTTLIVPVVWLLDTLFWGFSVEGRENLKAVEGGAVTVMNHIHPMDCTMVKLALFPHYLHMVSMKGNLELPVVGWLLKALGAVPLPGSSSGMLRLMKGLEESVKRGEWVHFYAEGLLVRYHREIRPFQRGAFLTAVRADCPVVPMRLICEEPHGIRKLWRRKPFLRLVIGEPLYRNEKLARREAVTDLMLRTQSAVEALGHREYGQSVEEDFLSQGDVI